MLLGNNQPGEHQQDKNLQQFNKFLKNNNQLLLQKYKQHFVHDKIKISAKEPSPQTVVNFISDVFSFDRDQASSAQAKHQIQSSLKFSYQTFIKSNKDIKQFNSKVAIQLLKFCIQSNQMFAVQYQNSKQQSPQMHQQTHSKQIKQEKQKAKLSLQLKNMQGTNLEDNPNEDSQNAVNKSSLSINNNQFTGNGNNSQSSSPLEKAKNRNSFDDGELQNQFNFHQEIKLDLDPVIIKKNIKVVFDYYCKQQMSLVPNSSFDRLERESHLMTIGKMLLMARMMNMFNSMITKQFLISKFRKLSEGKKQIDYKKFQILMSQLQIQDPTMIARSQLNSPNIYLYLKTTKKAFDTQDLQPRQLIKNRAFNKKLTAHSGKMQPELIQDLKLKRSSCMLDDKSSPKQSRIKQYYQQISQRAKQRYQKQAMVKQSQQAPYSLKRRQSQIINTKNLSRNQRTNSHDLSVMQIKKIIQISNDDDKWLGEYKIINPSSIKKAKNHDDNLQRKRSFQIKERNANLIKDLKNRVKQIEKSQNQTSSFDQTRPYLISSIRRN